MKVSIDDLSGLGLGYAVALSAGLSVGELDGHPDSLVVGKNGTMIGALHGIPTMIALQHGYYSPENDERLSSKLMDQFKVATRPYAIGDQWDARINDGAKTIAKTRVLAAMRCIVRANYPGNIDEDDCIDVPAVLLPRRPSLKAVEAVSTMRL